MKPHVRDCRHCGAERQREPCCEKQEEEREWRAESARGFMKELKRSGDAYVDLETGLVFWADPERDDWQ